MNAIYMMVDEKRNSALVKVGFTKDLEKRIGQYTTHNPMVKCISYMNTYQKTGRELETAFHDEIIKMGYEFVRAGLDGKKTEWFSVDYNDPFLKAIEENGLCAFKTGAGRKDKGVYVLK